MNWSLPDTLRPSAFLFFPLWLGYTLIVDAVVAARTGTSLLTRTRREFAWLFVSSAPSWWLFELLNQRTQNWEYLGADSFTNLQYFLLCTIAFSTVLPAVMGSAELVRSLPFINRFSAGPRLSPKKATPFLLLAAGIVMLSLTQIWPDVFYPLVWGAVFLILEPINIWMARPHLLSWLARGDWRPVVALSLGSLLCGFFWECWNYYAFPKWIYHTPGAQFLHVFEMPLLGYLGYLPFAWELFSLAHLILPRRLAPRL